MLQLINHFITVLLQHLHLCQQSANRPVVSRSQLLPVITHRQLLLRVLLLVEGINNLALHPIDLLQELLNPLAISLDVGLLRGMVPLSIRIADYLVHGFAVLLLGDEGLDAGVDLLVINLLSVDELSVFGVGVEGFLDGGPLGLGVNGDLLVVVGLVFDGVGFDFELGLLRVLDGYAAGVMEFIIGHEALQVFNVFSERMELV